MIKKMVLLALILCLTGCASIVSKSVYPVNITSDPDGADISVVDENGMIAYTGTTPASIFLSAGGNFKGKDYTITFRKTGFEEYNLKVKRGLDGWYIAGNLLLGGIIGWLIVDPFSGAMWTLPDEVNGTLTPLSAQSGEWESVNIVTVDQLSPDLRSKLVRIN